MTNNVQKLNKKIMIIINDTDHIGHNAIACCIIDPLFCVIVGDEVIRDENGFPHEVTQSGSHHPPSGKHASKETSSPSFSFLEEMHGVIPP
jgi:hypothetical protein